MTGAVPKKERRTTLAQLACDRQIIVKHHKNQEVEKPSWVLPSPSGPMLQLVHAAHLPDVAGSQEGGKKTGD